MSEELLPQDSTPAVESTPVESSAAPEPVETTSTDNVQASPQPSVWDSFKGLPDFEGKMNAALLRVSMNRLSVRRLQLILFNSTSSLFRMLRSILITRKHLRSTNRDKRSPSKFSKLHLHLHLSNKSRGGIRHKLSLSISVILSAMRMGERRLLRMHHLMRVTR